MINFEKSQDLKWRVIVEQLGTFVTISEFDPAFHKPLNLPKMAARRRRLKTLSTERLTLGKRRSAHISACSQDTRRIGCHIDAAEEVAQQTFPRAYEQLCALMGKSGKSKPCWIRSSGQQGIEHRELIYVMDE